MPFFAQGYLSDRTVIRTVQTTEQGRAALFSHESHAPVNNQRILAIDREMISLPGIGKSA